MEERTTVDADEAYVSGNLSSGSFPSIGAEKQTPTSLGAPLNTDTGGERRKFTSKGQDGASQLPGRRKGGRRSTSGYAEGPLGMSGSGSGRAHVHPGSLPTPTTQLSRQINQMEIMSPMVGKRTRAERADDMSPMSDAEGGSHSLNDPGYGSLPHGPTSLEQSNSLQKERGQSGSGTTGTVEKEIPVPLKPTGVCVCVCVYVYVRVCVCNGVMLLKAVSVNAVVVRRRGTLELKSTGYYPLPLR